MLIYENLIFDHERLIPLFLIPLYLFIVIV